MSSTATVLIASAGRRNYLVRWFREALAAAESAGQVIVADSVPSAPARREADQFERLPPIEDATYPAVLQEVCRRHRVSLALSLNDYELSTWSQLSWPEGSTTTLLRLSPEVQTQIEDKCALPERLATVGISSPETATLQDWLEGAAGPATSRTEAVVVKNRFGSGSGGLQLTTADLAHDRARDLSRVATDRRGHPLLTPAAALDATIVQPRITGVEYGLDVVCDLQGRYATTLVRRKLAMRSGETDRAITVASEHWQSLGRRIAAAIPHAGTIDVDVIVDADGEPWVLDINPRFGGGYPFSHLAGADVPAAYVTWMAGRSDVNQHLTYTADVAGAKFIDVACTPVS